MSHPTVLGPWFVVQRFAYGPTTYEDDALIGMVYYTATEEGPLLFQDDKNQAMLFMSLHSAARIAVPETAQIRVLTTEDEAKEFGRA